MTKLPPNTESTPEWAEELSDKERRFVEAYVISLNGKEAAIAAGMGRNPKSASEMASKLRKKPRVAEAISKLMNQRSGMAGVSVVNEIAAIAYSRITDYLKLDENGRAVLTVKNLEDLPEQARAAICKLKQRVLEDGTIITEVELHPKMEALDRLGRVHGIYRPERFEAEHHHEHELVDPMKRIQERLAALRRNLDAEPVAEIDGPPKRTSIAPPRPEPQAPVIDIE
jgi:phage terminase small subunit